MAQIHYGVANNVETNLDGSVTDIDTIITVLDASVFVGIPIPFVITLSNFIDDTNIELCEVTAVNVIDNELTVNRNTPNDFPALSHLDFTRVTVRPIAQHVTELQDHVERALLRDPENEGTNTVAPGGDYRGIVANAPVAGTKVAATMESVSYSTDSYAADHLVLNDEHMILVDTTTGNITITLPPASVNVGRELHIKKVAGPNLVGLNDVVIQPDGAETIDGDTTARIAFLNSSGRLVSDGTGWVVS